MRTTIYFILWLPLILWEAFVLEKLYIWFSSDFGLTYNFFVFVSIAWMLLSFSPKNIEAKSIEEEIASILLIFLAPLLALIFGWYIFIAI